jgi:hypothetical protein
LSPKIDKNAANNVSCFYVSFLVIICGQNKYLDEQQVYQYGIQIFLCRAFEDYKFLNIFGLHCLGKKNIKPKHFGFYRASQKSTPAGVSHQETEDHRPLGLVVQGEARNQHDGEEGGQCCKSVVSAVRISQTSTISNVKMFFFLYGDQ